MLILILIAIVILITNAIVTLANVHNLYVCRRGALAWRGVACRSLIKIMRGQTRTGPVRLVASFTLLLFLLFYIANRPVATWHDIFMSITFVTVNVSAPLQW